MFSIPGKQAVSITDRAAAHISRLMAKNGHQGLRIGVKKGGCAGMEYTMEYVDVADPNDETVEQDGARVMIAPMAQMFLFGTEIDYETSRSSRLQVFWVKRRTIARRRQGRWRCLRPVLWPRHQ